MALYCSTLPTLWQAGMSSMNYHLKEMVGIMPFTIKELSIIVTQVEACLNSCLLTALSNDPNDLTYLSLGHFLIGAPLTSFPHPNLLESVICLGGSTGNRSNNIFGKGDP